MAFLDKDGLAYLWSKISGAFLKKTGDSSKGAYEFFTANETRGAIRINRNDSEYPQVEFPTDSLYAYEKRLNIYRSTVEGEGVIVSAYSDSYFGDTTTKGIIGNLDTPVYSYDAANKDYVDNAVKDVLDGFGIIWGHSEIPVSVRDASCIAYGDGKFVVLPGTNNITKAAYSTDAINWQETDLPFADRWKSLAYGNGKFIAIIAWSKNAIYSTDGITWTVFTLPSGSSWSSITYGNGKFVIISSSTNVLYSTDGITWTASRLPSGSSWSSITYGNGKFVVVGKNSSTVAYSEDGITWETSTLPVYADWRCLAYGNGKFVSVGHSSDKVVCSADGITWETSTLPFSSYWDSIVYANGKFLAASFSSSKGAYSTDGFNWNACRVGAFSAVVYGNGRYVGISNASRKIRYGDPLVTLRQVYGMLKNIVIIYPVNETGSAEDIPTGWVWLPNLGYLHDSNGKEYMYIQYVGE